MTKVLVSLAIVVAIAFALKRRGTVRAQSASRGGASAGMELRRQVLSRAAFASVAANVRGEPRCVVMDWNLSGSNVATVAAFDDGTTSLYLSSGGGIIGAGAHEAVKRAAARFREIAMAERASFAPTTQFALPADGQMVFYLVTDTETLSTGPIANAALQTGAHPLSRLAGQAQAVIAAMREATSAPNQGAV